MAAGACTEPQPKAPLPRHTFRVCKWNWGARKPILEFRCRNVFILTETSEVGGFHSHHCFANRHPRGTPLGGVTILEYIILTMLSRMFFNGSYKETPMRDIRTHAATREVETINYHTSRLMVRGGNNCFIMRSGSLFVQYVVSMFANIEDARLLFIRLSQSKLRAEEYLHLRDAINGRRRTKSLQVSIWPSGQPTELTLRH